ncbi:high-potential iron-sulfur protein [Rhodopseudomonas palustris]|uniref:High-potential iron-sulfur protein n=1 Tax=Thiospirillum jenense TaxID=1653858 RepID=A0A839H524_9GAMM|nr:high-potential iron-sulfur protein [Thiospirillum jenense]MBB1089749.1 high-potential iron-sulfur protein [Rhodopseudomonas palustris]MBB1124851.1 high-potential iron-sulfur protein [Thiospirillum jenense]
MSDKQMNKSRRDAVKLMIGGLATVPLLNLVGMAAAHAEDLPHVDPATDATAQALKYVNDAAQADRATNARPGLPPDQQRCAVCQFVLAETGAWRPCSLFPGKLVNENGWCTSWTMKAG